MSRVRVVIVLAVLAGVIGASPVAAQDAEPEPAIRISTLNIDRYPAVTMVIDGVNMVEPLDPDLITITENGEPVPPDRIQEIAQIGDSITPTGVVLVIDASMSMEGEPLEEAKAAALGFVEQKRPQDSVAVIAFGREKEVQPFTRDEDELRRFIEAIEVLGNQTPLYDAVFDAAALFALEPDVDANAIVLSDGANTDRSTTHTLDEAISAAQGVGMTIYSIGLQGTQFDERPLRQMAEQTGGAYFAATDPDELVGLFEDIGSVLDNRVVARFTASETDHIEVEFGATYDDELTASQTILVPGFLVTTVPAPTTTTLVNPATYRKTSTLPASPDALKILVAVAAFAIVAMFVLILAWGREDEERLGGRLRVYGTSEARTAERGGILSRLPIFRHLSAQAEAVAQRRGLTGALNSALDAANILLRPGEAIAAAIGLAAVAGGLVAVLMKSFLWGGMVFLIAVLIVFSLVERAGRQERARFEQQLPDTLTLMATSLRAGYSLVQAVESVAGESPNPTGREFGRAVAESRLGRPVVQSLQGISDRMSSEDFRWTVMAIEIQREVGGNLSEVLQTVADTMVARNRLRGEVKAITAEGRISGVVLVLIPVLLFGFLLVVNPNYLEPLLTNPIGVVALVVAGLLLVMGIFWLRRLVDVEV
jgi:tight adherence protein B